MKHTSNGIIESLLRQVASLIRGIEDLVVEDGEVEGKAETDGVGRGELGLGNLGGGLIGLEGLVGRVLALVADGELGEVTVIVTLPATLLDLQNGAPVWVNVHLVVEHLGLAGLGGGDEVRIEDGENILADLGKLALNLLAILLNKANLSRVALGLLLLLDRGDDSPRRAAGPNDVLVRNGEEVALLDGEITVLGGDNLHVVHHLCDEANWSEQDTMTRGPHLEHTLITLGLLSQLGQVNSIVVAHFEGVI